MEAQLTTYPPTQSPAGKPFPKHFRIHHERPFLFEERPFTTLLLGGLSPAHDYLFEATMQGLGIQTKALPPTNLDAFHYGREYGNNGLCNPSYFTVGNLIRFLKSLEQQGMDRKDIIENYVFFTIGCNAPCRFGMLETEYRMALKDSGFEGFRILAFENEGGLHQRIRGNAFKINPEFFLAAVNAINLADVLNDLVYATRPYEVIPGKTNEVWDKALAYLYDKLRNKKRVELSAPTKALARALNKENAALVVAQFWDQLSSHYYTDALKKVQKMFDEVEMDRFRSKTVVKITGEFWAQLTVGAGNFNMFSFLEKEGAVLLIEPVASLLQFLLGKGTLRHRNRREILIRKDAKQWWQVGKRLRNYIGYQKKLSKLLLGTYAFRREYRRLMEALGGDSHMLLKQSMLEKLANPFYNINIEGSEGYMEVAKNIYYHQHHLAHMVLSLKPFGCMPSTQSDGTQAAVIEKYKDIIFLPLETAGEGEANAHSRVLMSLGDARAKAKQELQAAKATVRSSMEEMKAFVEAHPVLKNPTYVVPQYKNTVNRAANFMYHVDHLIQQQHTPIKT